ncbi:hypothetical protein PIB30_090430 [Stylosanthes scabra]|uniref:Uncharacterized protein n=1 Tax=Stylosanthes scabra TaxID=79078 RepID=A0ABU6RUR9_9FABA|nr:hypothetical protein [Stylosanthes scabra]
MGNRGKGKQTKASMSTKGTKQRKKRKVSSQQPVSTRLAGCSNWADLCVQYPATQPTKFCSLMEEEQFDKIVKKNFHFEQQLEIPEDLQQYLEGPINKWGWQFLYQPPVQVNATLVKEFYANFCWHDLDSVFLRGYQIPISEAAIRDFYKITTPPPKGKNAFQK